MTIVMIIYIIIKVMNDTFIFHNSGVATKTSTGPPLTSSVWFWPVQSGLDQFSLDQTSEYRFSLDQTNLDRIRPVPSGSDQFNKYQSSENQFGLD